MEETTINNPQLPSNPTKFYTHFLYKAIFVSIFILLLPFFPSQAPDFINKKTINTTSWEFLQLIFVGIAVSYGLFSKRNDEAQKEDGPFKPENTQSYVARLLQVSSVFDDDHDNPSASTSGPEKVQTWNSQYYRGEPIVVVAKESDEAATTEKPLVLPVRSLKTGGLESFATESNPKSYSRSNSRRISRNLSKLSQDESEDGIVLRSPIPWRSRSGRLITEVKEDFHQTPSVHDSSETKPINSPSFKYQSSNSLPNPHSEDQIHPLNPTSSSEIPPIERRKITKKSSFKQIPTPPPPPPLPPPSLQRPVNLNNHELKRNSRSVPEDYRTRPRRSADFTTRTLSDTSAETGKSINRRKESEFDEYLSHDKEIERFIERKGSQRKKLMEDSDESEEEDDDNNNNNKKEEEEKEEEVGPVKNEDMAGSDNGGPDVDKKADEFIAKFREQIRLQRIASIRKSTAAQNGAR